MRSLILIAIFSFSVCSFSKGIKLKDLGKINYDAVNKSLDEKILSDRFEDERMLEISRDAAMKTRNEYLQKTTNRDSDFVKPGEGIMEYNNRMDQSQIRY